MPSATQIEWLNENELRSYPFSENSSRIPSDPSGGVLGPEYAIPNYVFSDILLSMPFMERFPEVFLSALTMAGGIVTAVFSAYDPVSQSVSVIGSAVSETSVRPHRPTVFTGSGHYEGVSGTVVFGDLSRFESNFPDGTFFFDHSQTTLEARCVRPSARCVSGVVASDSADNRTTKVLTGVVPIIAGSNVRLSYVRDLNAIKIDVDSNAGYNETCNCDGSSSQVRFINGISASNVKIEGGDCISVEVKNGSIILSDTCAKPCCGCDELNFLNLKSSELATSVSKLSDFANTLSSRMTDFKENFLESERSPVKAL